MKVSQMVVSGSVLVILAGCSVVASMDSKRIDYGSTATPTPKLEIPPDLTTPGSDDRYAIPAAESVGSTTYSAYSKGVAVQARGPSAVLPEIKGVHLDHNATQRWLVVNDQPENVWAVVKAFWQELGLTINSEDQAAGVMETEWAENRAKIPQSRVRSVIGKVFDRAYSSSERDQYRTRLQRSKDGASTEVYISYYGKEEVFSADKTTSKWQALPADPEIEAIMLQRLMVRFGVSETQAASAVTATTLEAVIPPVVAVDATTNSMPEPAGTSSLRAILDGSTIIVMNDQFDRAWRKVGLAIEGAGLEVEDKDREQGIYFLRPVSIERGWFEKLQFWKSKAESTRQYRVKVKDAGVLCEVSVIGPQGATDTTSKNMTEAIYRSIGK